MVSEIRAASVATMSIIFYYNNEDRDVVESQLRAELPEHQIAIWPQTNQSKYAIVWNPPEDFFDQQPDLQCIFSIAAGVDHLLDHPGLPANVPIARLEDAGMGEKIAEYVLYGVLHAQRSMTHYALAQGAEHWDETPRDRHAHKFTVGILGIGAIGSVVASRLLLNGYKVKGWSRREKTLDGVDCYHGQEQIPAFLSQVDALVCLLPLTPETTRILNREIFNQLPKGAYLINAARGRHVHNEDLLAALEVEQLSGALLDVTEPEPLPAGHPFWHHPKIVVTPHVAGPTQASESIKQIADNIKRFEAGEPLSGLVDISRGY